MRSLAPVATLVLLASAGCTDMSLLITPVPTRQAIEEKLVLAESAFARDKIAMIDIDGVLRNRESQSLLGFTATNPVVAFKEKLDAARDDPRVRAVIVRINSPGGGVTASDLMYEELRRFREAAQKPVIASILDVGASGGYYIACAADEIHALPTTITGSIGVIMLTPDFSGTMRKIGLGMNIIKSGEMKDAGSPFRAMSEEDRAVFQGLIDRMYERFVDIVVASRTNLTRDQVRALADGRVYLGEEAAEVGLVDHVGAFPDTIAAAKARAGLSDTPVRVVQYGRPLSYQPNIYAQAPTAAGSPVSLIALDLPEWLDGTAPQFMYLWAPGW